MINLKSEGVRVKGYKGTWYVVCGDNVTDIHGKSKMVYALEHEFYGEDADPLFVNSKGEVIEELEGYLILEDIIQDMKNNKWD